MRFPFVIICLLLVGTSFCFAQGPAALMPGTGDQAQFWAEAFARIAAISSRFGP